MHKPAVSGAMRLVVIDENLEYAGCGSSECRHPNHDARSKGNNLQTRNSAAHPGRLQPRENDPV